MEYVIFGLMVAAILAWGYYYYVQEKKRVEVLRLVASRLGLSFSEAEDHTLADQYGFLDRLRAGSNRYCYNVMRGTGKEGEHVCLFDYHYETKSSGGKGRSRTRHHYYSVYTLIMPKIFPELSIEPESFFDKIAQAFGFDDIDFESREFSRRYKVKSPDKKFAYDVCNTQMIDYLLKQKNVAIELEGNTLAMIFNGSMKPNNVIPNYKRLHKIRSLIPQYLFTDHST